MGDKTKELPSDVVFHVFIIRRVKPDYVPRPVLAKKLGEV